MAGTHYLDFRPSEIAASVAAAVVGEEHIVDISKACTRVDKVRDEARDVLATFVFESVPFNAMLCS